MPSFLLYLLKVSIGLTVVWLFYQLLLRRLTFYKLNRWYLLGYSLLAFFIPMVDIGPVLSGGHAGGEPVVIQLIPVIGPISAMPVAAAEPAGISGWKLLVILLVLGSFVLLIRSVIRWSSLVRLRRMARRIEGMEPKVYQVDADIIPFSFGRSIYINRHLHGEEEWSDIILHEYVHVRQRHTVDILLAELICIFNWYNPFSWLIRLSIRQNLEFIADQQVLDHGADKKGYQYHLLRVVGQPHYRLANSFNFSSLKKRIIMMNKMRSTKLQLVRFLLVVPVAAVLLLAFRDRYDPLTGSRNEGATVVMHPAVLVMGHPAVTVDKRVAVPGIAAGFLGAGRTADRPVPRKDTLPQKNVGIRMSKDTTHPLSLYLPDSVLYIADGKQMPPEWSLKSIQAGDIASINVIKKGKEAFQLFGERGKNGVIAITTKAYMAEHQRKDTLLITPHKNGADPIVIINGNEVSADSIKRLNPATIEQVNVYKGDSARSYGGKGVKNGVINITLKKESSLSQPPGTSVTVMIGDRSINMTADTVKMPDRHTVIDRRTGN